MSEKLYVGSSYKTENEKGTFYNFDLSADLIDALQGVGKRNEVALCIEKRASVQSAKSPTHNVYVGDVHSDMRELQMLVSKDKLLPAVSAANEYGKVKLFAASHSVGADLSNYSVALSEKDEQGKFQYIGRGYDEATKFGETRIIGNAYKTESPATDGGTNGKSYNLNIDADKLQKLTLNSYGDANLSIIPYKEQVVDADGAITEKTNYLVAESYAKQKNTEAKVSLHVANPNPDNQNLPTIAECTLHTFEDKDSYRLVVQDRNPDKIDKSCADLIVYENKFVKGMSADERKAILEDKKYIGHGWTNDPQSIRLSAFDLSPDGLTKAIDNNHVVKVAAILCKDKSVLNEAHLQQIETRLQNSDLKTSGVLVSVVKNGYERQQKQAKQDVLYGTKVGVEVPKVKTPKPKVGKSTQRGQSM
jgi:hypothetical protein